MPEGPLAGKRVLVTRAQHQAGKLSGGLRALGAEPVEVPVLEIAPPASFEPLDRALKAIQTYDWVIFTSANAVRTVSERLAELDVAVPAAPGLQVAAVGAATAAAAREAGWTVALVPDAYVAEGLVAALPAHGLAGKRILLARAEVARDVIPDALRKQSAEVDVVDAYRNHVPANAPARLRRAIGAGLDAVTFTSSSSVIHLRACAEAAEVRWPFDEVPALSIGPITSQTLRELGWEPAAEAERSDIQGLVEAVRKLFAQSARER